MKEYGDTVNTTRPRESLFIGEPMCTHNFDIGYVNSYKLRLKFMPS